MTFFVTGDWENYDPQLFRGWFPGWNIRKGDNRVPSSSVHPGRVFCHTRDGDYMAAAIRYGDLVISKPGNDVDNRSNVLITN